MTMITSATSYIETGKEIVPSWMRLERLEYCQGYLDDLYTGKAFSIKKFFQKFFNK